MDFGHRTLGGNPLDRRDFRQCPYCEGGRVVPGTKDEIIEHDQDGGASIEIEARGVPIGVCDRCGELFADRHTLRVRHEYVCQALGLLNPAQIRGIRDRHNLSQAEFAQITGFGEATISRWERGRLLQNRSSDAFLRAMLRHPSLVDELRGIAADACQDKQPAVSYIQMPRFRALPESDVRKHREQSRAFSLIG